jgi:CheY-like chemotaxis protein
MQILIIEDNPAEAMMFARCLEVAMDVPVKVHVRETLEDGISFIEDNKKQLDIVFLDLGLPDAHGWLDSCNAIRPFAGNIPFIVVTGDDNPEVARELLRQGFEDYIVKGGPKRHIAALRETVEFALCRHESTRRLNQEKEQGAECIRWLGGSYSA